ncbi:MAG: hypothetical protein AB1Z23_12395 [Eubacteriales bacterium]
MPYCPKCKDEYREGFTKCADCDVDLVDVLPVEQESEEEKPVTEPLKNEVVLETFTDNIEFMYVASMLDEMDIPFRVRTKGGQLLKSTYTHKLEVERVIFVSDEDFDEAMEVLESKDAYVLEDYDEDIEDDVDDDEWFEE